MMKPSRDLAISQARSGQIEAARQTAFQITDRNLQRWAWLQILYAQFFTSGLTGAKTTLEELRPVKETIALLSDHSFWLWYGSWVRDLLRALVNAGDSVGAIEIVGRIKNPEIRCLEYGFLAGLHAVNNDLDGVERTLSLLSEDPGRIVSQEFDLLDRALTVVARWLAWELGDIERARQYATRIGEADEREKILKQIEQPSLWSK